MSREHSLKRLKVWPLTILLIRQDLKTDSEILGDLTPLTPIKMSLHDGGPEKLVAARLYYKTTFTKPPKWAEFFGDQIDSEALPPTVSVPAVLLVPVDDRIFALPFAFGSSLIEPGATDPTFGLRAALNSINPEKVRSYDKRSFDALFRQTREQAAKETRLESFGIDAERDLVRSVAGKPQDKSLGSAMTGGKTLRVSTRMTPNRLVHYLRRILRISKKQEYSEVYPWLGRIEEELDSEMTKTLDSYLDDRLCGESEGLWLAVPEIIDWSETSGFRYVLENRNKKVFHDMGFEGLIEALGDQENLSVELLKEKRVEMLNDEDRKIKSWKLYECLNAEIFIGEEVYVLSTGAWYKIDSEFLKEVDEALGVLESPNFTLPLFSIEDEDEFCYNLRVARDSAGEFCCLDQELVRYGSNRNRFELCDLLRKNGDLVHVKRYGGSSVLSHLFAQGFVSADLLMKRNGFRENADKLITEKDFHLLSGRGFVQRIPRTLIYAIIGGPANRNRRELPLFSRVNLNNVVRSLRAYHWTVKILYVPETEERQKLIRQRRSGRR